MWRVSIAILLMPAMVLADAFTFTLGNPVASQDFRFKAVAFVFRTEGCADAANAHFSARAEGLVNGVRTSVALNVIATSTPGVYAVSQGWPRAGDWVVSLQGTCDRAVAGAVVPMRPSGFVRESSKFFPRPANELEINAALQTLSAAKQTGVAQ
jgi:hypothetical protein